MSPLNHPPGQPTRRSRVHLPLVAALALLVLLPGAACELARAQATTQSTDVVLGDTAPRDDRVAVGRSMDLPAGQQAHSVVAVMGSASVEGQASGDVVAVLGSVHASGPVGGDAVAVLGSLYVNNHVSGDAVAVLGSVELGPNAEVDGDVQSVGGQLRRDPGAIVHGQVSQIGANTPVNLGPVTPWARHALGHLRPLAWGTGLGWAWVVAAVFLGVYLLLAFLAPRGVQRCVQSLELHPGATILAALLSVLLIPPLLLLLVVTVIGIAAVPVVLLALFCATLFGKVAALAWLGGRFLGHERAGELAPDEPLRVVAAVAVGGVIILALYLVPVLGLIVFQLLGLLGLGMVVHTLLIAARERHGAGRPGASAGGATPAAPSVATDSAAVSGATGASAAPAAAAAESLASAAAPAATPRAGIDPSLPRAGFWIRMVALLLDAIIVGIILQLLRWHNVLLPVLAAYGAILWKARGATLGGIVFGLQVVRADGQPMDWTTAIVRALGCFLSLAVIGLGFFWIAFDEQRQAWHDKFAGTLVVRAGRAPTTVRA